MFHYFPACENKHWHIICNAHIQCCNRHATV